MSDKRYGATPSDWRRLAYDLDLKRELLPIVCRPGAPISEKSALNDYSKSPSLYNREGKVSGIKDWTNHQATDSEVSRWMQNEDYGICLQTRTVHAIDVDIEDAAQAQAVRDTLETLLGPLAARFRANSPRLLFLVQPERAFQKVIIRTLHGAIELLGSGQQCVVAGTHKSGERYQWEGEQIAEPVKVSAAMYQTIIDTLAEQFAFEPVTMHDMKTRRGKVSEAIDNDPTAQYLLTNWNVIDVDDNDGALFIECPFRDQHTDNAQGDTSTAYFVAHTHGYARGHFKCMHAHCADRPDSEFLEGIGLAESVKFEDLDEEIRQEKLQSTAELVSDSLFSDLDAGQPAPVEKKPFVRLGLESPADFINAPPIRWIVKGLIPEQGLVVVYGGPGCGKTFFTLDLALKVALTGPSGSVHWQGRRVARGCRVVYLAAEGAGGFRTRMQAAMSAHGLLDVPNFHVVPQTMSIMDKDDIATLAKNIRLAGGCELLVLDTFASVMTGDENSSVDMGKAIRHSQWLAKATGAAVILVHHTTKDGKGGSRGHSSLKGAADTEIEVSRFDTGERAALVVKVKDGQDGDDYGFRLHTVTLGVDGDGDPITSCVVEFTEGKPNREPPKKGKAKAEPNVQPEAPSDDINFSDTGGPH